MLFGLQVELKNEYLKIVENPFRLTNVSLGSKCQRGETVTLMLQLGKEDSYAICTLERGRVDQYQMDLSFEVGEEISFFLESDKLSDKVHLLGHYLDEEIPSDMEDYSDLDMDGEMDDEEWDSEDDENDEEGFENGNEVEELSDEEEEDEDVSSEELPEEQTRPPQKGKPGKQDAKKPEPSKKTGDAPTAQKRGAEEPQQPGKKQKPAEQATADKSTDSGVKKFPNGLVVQEVSKGKGPMIKEGNKVGIYYTGKLQNGKVFDSKTSGKPLVFTLGKKQVIPGMEMGIAGMHYGGKRIVTIPAPLGYGKKAQPGIPANSTLIFEITALESK